MKDTDPTPVARLVPERRRQQRRQPSGEEVLSLFAVFQRDERSVWRRIDRRVAIRRAQDVRRRIAKQR
jgi:antitoxin (DNA-binding transcriptional repressor) of toxin-antitoxin stability system